MPPIPVMGRGVMYGHSPLKPTRGLSGSSSVSRSFSSFRMFAPGLLGKDLRDKPSDRVAHFVWRVFLKKMRALHRDLLLVRPSSTEFPLLFNQKSCRLRVTEQLWYGVG